MKKKYVRMPLSLSMVSLKRAGHCDQCISTSLGSSMAADRADVTGEGNRVHL